MDLQLIQTETKKMKLSVPALRSIGRLTMFILDKLLPRIGMSKIFETVNPDELQYLRWFGQQLCIAEEDGLDRYNIPALSVLINKILLPHCDELNPLDYLKDFTFSLSATIPLSNINSDSMREKIGILYPGGVPLCFVAYRRKAIEYFVRYLGSIQTYVLSDPTVITQRNAIVKLLTTTQCDNDYHGNLFLRKDMSDIHNKCKVEDKYLFHKKMMTTSEAVEKSVSIQ